MTRQSLLRAQMWGFFLGGGLPCHVWGVKFCAEGGGAAV